MNIEARRGTTNGYATHSQRVNGKHRRQYLGRAESPAVQVINRLDQLTKAKRRNAERQRREEIAASRRIDTIMTRLSHILIDLNVINTIPKRFKMDNVKRKNEVGARPAAKQIRELCERADQGDEKARKFLANWLAANQSLVDEATDLGALASALVKSQLTEDDPVSDAFLDHQLNYVTQAFKPSGDDVIQSMHATILAVTYMDAMRCAITAIRGNFSGKSAKYWDAAFSRATRRYKQVRKSVEKYDSKANDKNGFSPMDENSD